MKFSFPCLNCFSSSTDVMVVNTSGQDDQNFRVFTYNELRVATHSFRESNKIGEGGFGVVYTGRLKDGRVVAVKVLSVELESMRGEREFISEIAALSNVKHENLVTLQGCCIDGANRFLVYDYMENNSLAHAFLEKNRIKFTWTLRRDISLGVARGIAYLHEEVDPHIVHRDIKATNILLDQNFIPKVSDFGLAKLFRDNASHISTRVAGTLGYLSPEYAITGHLSRKSDVYSFGVLLLEIVSGRPVVDFNLESGEQYLVDKAWEMYNADILLQLVDPVLNRDYVKEEAFRFLKVGLLCVQETTSLRPKMSEAVKMLTNEINIEAVKVSHPGLVADLMDVKIGQKHSSNLFSKASTSSG
ncbi:putative serine/threonine-protein kinase isoform X2 [Cornus florida]|uniref:putative serine/threonine-protein kinase isoform X2 n=1 Tax=Cornus florida TaxID=4283 RepID=UPI00289AD364|nr:putative serine/threonine-protein kinase isoform X2 [Cornus florida]